MVDLLLSRAKSGLCIVIIDISLLIYRSVTSLALQFWKIYFSLEFVDRIPLALLTLPLHLIISSRMLAESGSLMNFHYFGMNTS